MHRPSNAGRLSPWAARFDDEHSRPLDQLPPTLRGVRDLGTKPRVVFARHGCSERGFGARVDAVVTGSASGAGTAASSAAFARATAAAASSFARQHCLYLRPEPQGHGSLRPIRPFFWGISEVSVPYRNEKKPTTSRHRTAPLSPIDAWFQRSSLRPQDSFDPAGAPSVVPGMQDAPDWAPLPR